METRDKKVKIVATIGPASASLDNITQLIQHGVNVFRLNFSHGDHLSHSYAIEMIGKSARKTGYNVGIIADLQGPKIRTHSTLNNAAISVSTGEVVRITSVKVPCTSSVISIDYPNIAREIDIGQQIMINDGAIRLEVVSKKDYGDLIAKVTSGGEYSSHKGVNFPNVKLSIPSLTEKDRIHFQS
jgi:pyruvate kinase